VVYFYAAQVYATAQPVIDIYSCF